MPLDESQPRLTWPARLESDDEVTARLELARKGHPGCMLVAGENLAALRALRARATSSATLAYLDPPFFTGRTHVRISRRRDSAGKILRSATPAFEDRWDSLTSYLASLRSRIAVARDLLAEHGSLVLHVDPKTSHYAKIVCDEVFGSRCFASEIVWRYRRWPSKTRNFQRVHDVLLRFVKNPDAQPRFRQLYEPLAASTRATWGTHKQRAVVGASGVRTHSSRTRDESPGVPLGDVWEIGIVAPVARERTGYPTQKPEALLERLVLSCTDPDDLVLDPYAGSGTTLAVAHRLGRRVLGIDSSPEALSVIRQRMEAQGVRPLEERAVLPSVASLRAKAS